MSEPQPTLKKSSILNQLRGVFILGVTFLIISLFFFQSFNKKILNGIIDAYHLDGGIISIGHIQESLGKLDKTLSAAGQIYKSKDINQLYDKQFNDVSKSIKTLVVDFEKFKRVGPLLHEVQNSIKDIDKISKIILSDNWTMNQFNAYILSVQQYQIEANESLSKASIEFRALLDKTYNDIQEKKNDPFIFGLILTLLLALILSLLSSTIFRRVRLFISNHLSATSDISKGHLDIRVPVVQHDELGLISHEFNKMIGKLQTAKNELERSNQDLEDFAYTASHDLQTPLRHISAFSEMVAKGKDSASKEDLNQWAENIKISTNSVIHLIDDLLKFSKVGKEGMKKEDVSTDELLQRVIAQSQQSYSNLSIQRSPLPNIKGYKSLLHLVFQNLIDNAVKYCPADRKPEVSIKALSTEEETQFMVIDNGVGVPDEQKERIFGLFRRLHSDEEVKGSGAGLAICRKIIERHGGKIWVEDGPNQGSSFCFTIPK